MAMSTRFKDFDSKIFQPIFLTYKDVVVRSQSLEDHEIFNKLRDKNSSTVSPYEIKDPSSNPKMPLGIEYQGSPVGEITIWNINEKNKTCMISYWVDEEFRRKKIATYAVALVTDYCLVDLEMQEIEAPVQEENEASKELLKKLSYTLAGYETFTGRDDIRRLHETYLIVQPENGIEYKLVDFMEMMSQPPVE